MNSLDGTKKPLATNHKLLFQTDQKIFSTKDPEKTGSLSGGEKTGTFGGGSQQSLKKEKEEQQQQTINTKDTVTFASLKFFQKNGQTFPCKPIQNLPLNESPYVKISIDDFALGHYKIAQPTIIVLEFADGDRIAGDGIQYFPEDKVTLMYGAAGNSYKSQNGQIQEYVSPFLILRKPFAYIYASVHNVSKIKKN